MHRHLILLPTYKNNILHYILLQKYEKIHFEIYYILSKNSNFIAIEAKNANMNRGFNQLISELIAIDKIIEKTDDFLYGVVTTGNEWNFAILDRKNKIIIQDKNSLYLLNNLEDIFKTIIGILVQSPRTEI